MTRLRGKIALITGASSGIGLASARRFVDEGATVVMVARNAARLQQGAASIGPMATAVAADVTSEADLDRVMQVVRDRHGQLDILFANAGTGAFAPLGTITPTHYDRIFDLNVRGTLFTVQKALPLLRDGSAVLLTGSIAGSSGAGALSVYSASKAAVRAFARGWTADLRRRRVRVNVLSPGTVDTPMIGDLPRDALVQMLKEVPAGRLGTPEDMAAAAAFLVSDEAAYITGTELFVDGGAAQL